jgi:cell division protein FtsN
MAAAAERGAPAPVSQELYVQVSSTTNQQWAEDEALQLRVAGLRATVLPPEVTGEPYRVVIGPYATREDAEDIGRKLGKAYWIFTREAGPGPR